MSQLSLIQENNAQFIDYEPSPKVEGSPDDCHFSDVDRVVRRVGMYNQMSWDHLSSCWLPFRQTGPRERQNWSKRRLIKAMDQAESEGLIEALDTIGSKWRLTRLGVQKREQVGSL